MLRCRASIDGGAAMANLRGRTALVTGAARGIGAETAKALAAAGAAVALTDILEEEGEATAAAIRAAGGSAAFLRHDVTREAEWERVFAVAAERLGGPHIVVNNAGVFVEKPIEEMTLEEWRRQASVNLEGVFLGVKHAMRTLKETCPAVEPSGSIVNMSSVAGIVGSPLSAGYGATKGGVRLLTKSAALECAHFGYNIRVNSVHPGIIETDMMAQVARKMMKVRDADYEGALRWLSDFQPIGRRGRADEVARAVVFLASDDSSLMTGAELVLDGGLTAK